VLTITTAYLGFAWKWLQTDQRVQHVLDQLETQQKKCANAYFSVFCALYVTVLTKDQRIWKYLNSRIECVALYIYIYLLTKDQRIWKYLNSRIECVALYIYRLSVVITQWESNHIECQIKLKKVKEYHGVRCLWLKYRKYMMK